MNKYVNELVNQIEPYVPGEQPQDKKYVKLNTNENPYGPSPKVIEAMKDAINEDLRLYPDAECRSFRKALCDYYSINPDEVFVGNGSDEILAFCFKAFFTKGKNVLFPDISYSFYPVYSNIFELDTKQIPLDEDFNVPLEKMMNEPNCGVVLPNPNAPTGKFIEISKLKKLVEANKDSVVIIDEAYVDFGGESMIPYIHDYPNLLVVQTLSKSRALAGLRGGIAIGNKALIEGLSKVKNSMNSYTLDRVALKGATAAIEDNEYFEKITKKVADTRVKTTERLKSIGFTVLDSKANFVFAKHNNIPGETLYKLLKDKGILVRHFSKPARIDDFLRITIGTDKEMDILIDKLNEIIKEYK